MEIDKAIKHAEEVAEEQDMRARFDTDYVCYQMSDAERNQCKQCAAEHRQIAEWLKDYKRLLEEKHKDKWIRLAVEKPKEGRDVLIAIKHQDGEYQQAFSALYDYTYWTNFGRDINVTHWMPLQQPPEEVEE